MAKGKASKAGVNLNQLGQKKPTTVLEPAPAQARLPSHPHPPVQPPDGEARYLVRACFTTQSPLHVGAPDERLLSDDEARPAGNKNDRGIVPWSDGVLLWHGTPVPALMPGQQQAAVSGSTLKGALLARARRSGWSAACLQAVFGSAQVASTRPGQCEFRWAVGTACTLGVQARTAIDRHTRTVVPGKLFHADTVPPGTVFSLELVLHRATAEQARALYELLAACGADHPLCLGAHTRAGWGRLAVQGAQIETLVLGPQQLQDWLAADGDASWAQWACPVVWAQPAPAAAPPSLGLDIELQFDSPFACNDPQRDKTRPDRSDVLPRQSAAGGPLLPGPSFLGALRAQTERIARTLGLEVPQGHAAPPARRSQMPQDLCSLLFGCTGWKGLVGASEFVGPPETPTLTQDMIAICRVTGGGRDGAKFQFQAFVSPCLTGRLQLDAHRLAPVQQSAPALAERALALLVLALRDLQHGDISFGLGRSKGWGHCVAPGLYAKALHGWFGDDRERFAKAVADIPDAGSAVPHLAATHPAPARDLNFASPPKLPYLLRNGDNREINAAFHNPYQFLPFSTQPPGQALGLHTVAATPQALAENGHSHDRYHPGRYSGELVCHLELITPAFIGADRETEQERSARNAGDDAPWRVKPFTYRDATRNVVRAIPGTSLRGMVGAVIEAISGSALRVLDAERPLSVRMTAESALPCKGQVVEKKGRLHAQSLDTAKPGCYPIPDPVADVLHALADARKGELDKNGLPYPIIRNAMGRPIARPMDRSNPAKPEPAPARLAVGQLVYFQQTHNEVSEIAWSQIWRRGVFDPEAPGGLTTLADLVRHHRDALLPLGVRATRDLHPAELLLGVVEQGKQEAHKTSFALASKLAFSMALPIQPVTCAPDWVVLKELSTPKPPSPALYMQPTTGPARYISKAELAQKPSAYTLNGRKAYLHAQQTQVEPWLTQKPPLPSPLPRLNGRELQALKSSHQSKRQASIQPLCAGNRFAFTIRFDNLSTQELGLLCAAIRPSADYVHRLGMGKPLGLGSVKLSFEKLRVIDRGQHYQNAADNPAWQTLDALAFARQGMAALCTNDRNLYAALRKFGEPGHVQHPVHYPQVAGMDIETENYQWWVANDRRGKQFLNQKLP